MSLPWLAWSGFVERQVLIYVKVWYGICHREWYSPIPWLPHCEEGNHLELGNATLQGMSHPWLLWGSLIKLDNSTNKCRSKTWLFTALATMISDRKKTLYTIASHILQTHICLVHVHYYYLCALFYQHFNNLASS